MVKLQNPNSHLQRGDSRAVASQTPVTVLTSIKCHKCSFAAPAFPIASFCLEIEVVNRSGKKITEFCVEVFFWGEFSAGKVILFRLLPCVYSAIAYAIAGLIEKKKCFTLSFLSLQGRRLETWAEVDELFSVDTMRVHVFSNHHFPQCSAELRLLVQKYLGKKRITPAPLCFPYIHSQVVLCAPGPPWIYSLG